MMGVAFAGSAEESHFDPGLLVGLRYHLPMNLVANLAVGMVTNAPADREIIALIAYLVVANVVVYGKLKKLETPAAFLRLFVLGRAIQHLGLIVLLVLILFGSEF